MSIEKSMALSNGGNGFDLAYTVQSTIGMAQAPWDTIQVSGDFSTDWHVYAIEWQKDDIDWYIDAFRVNEAKQNLAVDGPTDAQRARARPVTLGPVQGNLVVITSGLQAGERVVVMGASLVVDGEQVRVIP